MKTHAQKISVLLATVGPVGYLPAPGTCASALTALVAYMLPTMSVTHALVLLTIFSILSAFILASALRGHVHTDPSEFVQVLFSCLVVLR